MHLYRSFKYSSLGTSLADTNSGGIKGGGMGAFAPQSEALPPHLPPQSEEKNGPNQPFSANF